VADNYSRRLSGWIVPAKTGPYRFWSSSNQENITALGGNEVTAYPTAISSVEGSTAFQSFDEQGVQKSELYWLEAGRPYYIQSIQRDATGSDHLAVAWQGPGFSRQVIPTTALIPRNSTNAFPSSVLTATELWRINQFGANAGISAIAGPDADPDNDGNDNRLEYALDLSPTAPTALSQRLVYDIDSDQYLRLTITKNPAATDVTYIVEVSSDLINWNTTQTLILQNTSTTLRVRDTLPKSTYPRRFIRLRVTSP
jgi:hypothetical protein